MLATRWFENNYMKLNTDKCCLLISGYKHEQVWANIRKDLTWESNNVNFLGITIDRDNLIKSKANQKLSALSRMTKWLSFNKGKILLFRSLNLDIVLLLECFKVDVPITKLIGYIRELLKLFMISTSQLLINYLSWTNLSVFTIKNSRDS